MQRTTACSLSYFQPISRLRDLPKQVFGISCGEKCDCASPKRSKSAAAAGKSAIVRVFRLSRLAQSHFSLQRRRFSRSNRAAKAEAIRRDLSGTRALRSPPQARLRMRPPDTSRRHTLRAHLTNAPSENARENGRDDVSAPARARPNDAGDARASGQATFARRFGQPRAAAQCIG